MPLQEDHIQQILSSGAEALHLVYETVRQFGSPRIFIRTSLLIHSLELGTLSADQYSYVAQRTSQADRLFRRHLHKLLDAIPDFLAKPGPISFFTVPACGRMVKNGTLSTVLFEELAAHPQVNASMLCVELSADLLFEDLEPLVPELQKLQNLGVAIALTQVGDEYTPLLRLGKVPFQLAFLDPYALSLAGTGREVYLVGLNDFLHAAGKKVLAVHVENSDLLPLLEQLGCDGYTLKSSGSSAPEGIEEGPA